MRTFYLVLLVFVLDVVVKEFLRIMDTKLPDMKQSIFFIIFFDFSSNTILCIQKHPP